MEALGTALAGTDRPLIVTSGTGLVERSAPGALVTEADPAASSAKIPRAATEEAVEAVLARGVHVMVLRLTQTNDTRNQGRVAHHIRLAQEKGRTLLLVAWQREDLSTDEVQASVSVLEPIKEGVLTRGNGVIRRYYYRIARGYRGLPAPG